MLEYFSENCWVTWLAPRISAEGWQLFLSAVPAWPLRDWTWYGSYETPYKKENTPFEELKMKSKTNDGTGLECSGERVAQSQRKWRDEGPTCVPREASWKGIDSWW